MPDFIQFMGEEVEVESALLEIERMKCEESLGHFLRASWKHIDPAPFTTGWVIDAVAEHLEAVCDGQIKRLIINIPPRCSKSSIVSVAFPAWTWAQRHQGPTSGPKVPFLHASYAFTLSLRDSIKCRRLIQSPWYQKMWGDRFQLSDDQNRAVRFGNTQGGERLITSIGAGVTGEGGNVLCIDDGNAANEVLSEAVIKTTNEDWWDGTMSTRLNDPKTGAFVVVQQRLGEEDLSGHILSKDKGEWTHLMLPMRYEPNRSFVTSIGWKDPREAEGELLWPERFGEQEIRTLESDLGKWRSSGQLQQRPEPAGGGIIKREWWNLWPPEGEPVDANGKPTRIVQFPPFDFIIASLDTAYTEKTMNDPSALSIWGVFSGDTVAHEVKLDEAGNTTRAYVETSTRIMLIHCWSEHLELHPLVQKVAKSCGPVGKGGFNVDKLLIEDKAAGHSVAQELRRLFQNEPYSIQLINPKAADKMARLYSVQNLWEKGMIYAPDRPWAEMMIAECGTFPHAKRDDLVDTASQALRHMRDIGLLIHGEERQAEAEESMRYRGRPLQRLYPV